MPQDEPVILATVEAQVVAPVEVLEVRTAFIEDPVVGIYEQVRVVAGTAAIPGPPGPQGPTGVGAPVFEAENKSGSTIYPGMVLATHPSGSGVILADRTVIGSMAVGVAITEAEPGFTVEVQTSGPVELVDWTYGFGSVDLVSPVDVWVQSSGTFSTSVPVSGRIVLLGRTVGTKILSVAPQLNGRRV